MALGHGSGFIKSWLAPRLSPALLSPPLARRGYCCWRRGSSPQGEGLEAQGHWGLSESGRPTVRWAEPRAERLSRIERRPWKTPPPDGAAPGTRPRPCCHSFVERNRAAPHPHSCPSARLAAGRARRCRGESMRGGGGVAGQGSGAGVVGKQRAYAAAAGCRLGPGPHLHCHCPATSSSAVGTGPETQSTDSGESCGLVLN